MNFGFSETIVAAIIGATATFGTAIFQLMRNRAPLDTRPKRNRVKSAISILAMMLACFVGGYAWSELRTIDTRDEIKALRAELTGSLQAMQHDSKESAVSAPPVQSEVAAPTPDAPTGVAEAIAQLPACRAAQVAATPDSAKVCPEGGEQAIALCAAVPEVSSTSSVHLFARQPQGDATWQEFGANDASQVDLRVSDATLEQAAGSGSRTVCVRLANRDPEREVAVRLVVDYSLQSAAVASLL
jgi:hypothetical protein